MSFLAQFPNTRCDSLCLSCFRDWLNADGNMKDITKEKVTVIIDSTDSTTSLVLFDEPTDLSSCSAITSPSKDERKSSYVFS